MARRLADRKKIPVNSAQDKMIDEGIRPGPVAIGSLPAYSPP